MNKQFILSVVVLFVVTMAMGFLVHGVLLADDYLALTNIMRPPEDQESLFHFMILAHLLISIALTWIYRMGKDPGKEWLGQGVRFGIAIAMVSVIPLFMIYYVVQQTPETLAIKQIAFESVDYVLLGIVTAFMNRS